MIKEISSKSNARIKYVVSLQLSKYRKEHQQFIAEGKKSLMMAIEKKMVKEIYTLKPIFEVPDDIVQYIVSEEIMNKISTNKSPEGIVFLCDIPRYNQIKMNKCVYLDHINDPGNAGTIIRTALAFGYDAVVFSSDSVDIYNEKVISATKGAIFEIPTIKEDLENIKFDKIVISSTLSDESKNMDDIHVTKPFILVFGNESHGISKKVNLLTDIFVKIPIETMESLNVSVAAGILLYKFR